ncbi:hypothetical protein [Pseudoalteromonas sp. MSK9-3]|uniref:hypothetical protein n=1 Tax=Pseudoalteromonas sp. MSK9-3 TaxID=1897633 RepID=UPI001602BC09|nr:hypothetical protein [Pseudoalteromonas sp. MSK9-3]
MKLNLKKAPLKNLSTKNSLPNDATPQIAGGASRRACRPPVSQTGGPFWACEC